MKSHSRFQFIACLAVVLTLAGCIGFTSVQGIAETRQEILPVQVEATQIMTPAEAPAPVTFIDDMGSIIELQGACKRMIVLYSAHVENLYSLGVEDQIIGVYTTAIYPPDAASKPVYDYDSDPEKVIAADPDCVLLRPFIDRKNPDFVDAIKKAGITVVSLYPDSFDAFDEYILKLGMMTGAEERAAVLLDEFHGKISEIQQLTAAIEPKKTAYFESTETNYRTVTVDSMPARAIEFAGGINIAADVEPVTAGSTIASFGIEKILMNAENIDVYISQRGAMNAGGNIHSITIREGFENIKAVREGAILEINEKIISSPTFRYYKGVHEIARALYPEVIDEIDSYRSDELITREDFAAIIVRFDHKPVYIPSSSKYYQQEHTGHTYGLFHDVPWNHKNFDNIETAVLAAYLDGKENESGEYFDPSGTVTRDEFAKTIYIMGDYGKMDTHVKIDDLEQCENAKIIQILVDNQVFDVQDGKFNPEQALTYNDVIDFLKNLEKM